MHAVAPKFRHIVKLVTGNKGIRVFGPTKKMSILQMTISSIQVALLHLVLPVRMQIWDDYFLLVR